MQAIIKVLPLFLTLNCWVLAGVAIYYAAPVSAATRSSRNFSEPVVYPIDVEGSVRWFMTPRR